MIKEITSVKNPLVNEWLQLKTKKQPDSSIFLVEGYHLVEEAFNHHLLKQIITINSSDFDKYSVGGYLVSDAIIKKLASTINSQGIFGIVNKMNYHLDLMKSHLIIVLDQINDPGNLGTIIRSASALGADGIILTNNTCDLYNDKTIRASQGTIFTLPIVSLSLEATIKQLKDADFRIYATSLQASNYLEEVQVASSSALIFGNEATGISDYSLENSDETFKIKMHHQVESLNVAIACSLCLYYFKGAQK